MATGRDIVHNLVLNSDRFSRGAMESRRAHRELTKGIEQDLARVRERMQTFAERSVREGGFGHHIRGMANEERKLLEQRAEAMRRMEEARRAAAGPVERSEIVRQRRSEEQQLSRTRQLLQQVAAEEARTGQSRATQIERLIRLESSLNARIAERQAILSRVRDAMFVGPIVKARETEHQQLTRIRTEMERLTVEYSEQGRVGGARLMQLANRERELTAAIERRAAMLDRARMAAEQEAAASARAGAIQRGGAAPIGSGGRMGRGAGASMLGTGLAFGLSDAATAYQYGGGRAAALSASNNLPMIGEGLSSVAESASKVGGRFGAMARVVSRYGGRAGLWASAAIPLATLFIPKLRESKNVVEDAKEAYGSLAGTLERVKAARANEDFLKSLRQRPEESLVPLRETVAGLTTDLENATRAHTRLVRELSTRMDIGDLTMGQEVGIQAAIKDSAKLMAGLRSQIAERQALIREGEAAISNRRRPFDWAAHYTATGVQREEHQRKQDELFNGPARREAARRAMLDEQFMRASILSGIGGRLGQLRRQRDAIGRGERVFQSPEAVSRTNMMDRLIQMRQDAGKDEQEKRHREQMKKADEQIRATEKLYEAVRNLELGRPVRG